MEVISSKGAILSKRGFTLIELLVVVLIIGLLAAVALPQYNKVIEKVRLQEALSLISSLEKAIHVYLLENGYPDSKQQFLGDKQENQVLSFTIPTTNRNRSMTYANTAVTDYFSYSASCNTGDYGGYCDITANRIAMDNTRLYYIFIRKTATGVTTRSCTVENNSPVGTQMCTLLKKEGYTLQ